MRWLLTSMLVLMGFSGQAQDWAPYVPGQVSYFRGSEGDSNKVLKRTPRAVFPRSGHTTMYFHDGLREPCRADEVTTNSQYLIDSLVVDSARFTYYVDGKEIEFPLDVPIGYTWRTPVPQSQLGGIDSVECRFDSVGWIGFLGLQDSVRYYSTTTLKQGIPQNHGINEHGMWLSKHYGLIQTIGLIPTNNPLAYGTTSLFSGTLVGLSNDTLQSGFTLPDVMEFFNYAPGDILKWKRQVIPHGLGITETWFYRDSILSVSKTDSTIHYNFIRAIQKDGNIGYGHTGSVLYERKSYRLMTDANSQYLAGGNPPIVGESVWEIGEIDLTNNDVCIRGEFNGGWINNDCLLESFADAFAEIHVCLTKGFVFSMDGYSGQRTTLELLGRTSSGDVIGNTWPLGAPPIEDQTISVYPNPTRDQFSLGLPSQVLLEGTLSIQDITGRTVLQKPLNGQSTWPVNQFQPGLYLITVTTDDGRYQTKLIVQ